MITQPNIQTSGGIFTHHFIESLQQDRVGHPALKAKTFTFPNYERLSEKELDAGIAETWEDLVERWDAVEREFGALDISTLRRRWLIPLFQSLGFNLDFNKGDIVLEDDFRFPISHLAWAGTSDVNIPIHTLLYESEKTLETKAKPGRGIKAMAPHDMLQRYLNLSNDHSWGLLSDGVYLRLLRDYYHTYTRGYTEFDLQGIFSTRDYASFRAMFRLLHASRFIIPEGEEQAPIDELYEDALAMGVAVGKDLRDNVQKAIETMGNGFLQSTPRLFNQLSARHDGAHELYHEILVTIYRILFLLFAEQRGMLPGRGSVYIEEFSLTAFRTLAESPQGDDSNVDLWEKLKTTFAMIEHGVEELDIFPYNGALFSLSRTPLLTPPDNQESPRCRNDALLTTIRHLTTVEKDKVLQRISYSDLSVEEIGSIYESLLEITPRISTTSMMVEDRQIPSNTFFLDLRGMGRKTTGSYYTPPSLVNELIQSALVPVMLDRLQTAVPGYDSEIAEALNETERQQAEEALLKIKVVDPASGSGAFLIAADNKLGLELARIRSGSIFPPEQVIRHARRDVLAHCIHGVDLNPMAVELCKVSLWINAAVDDAPLNFLDHHIQCGNSLVGAIPELVEAGIPNEAYNAVTGDEKDLATSLKRQNRQELNGQQSLNFKVTLIKDQQALKNWMMTSQLAESQPAMAEQAFFEYQISPENWQQRLPYDLWTAAFFVPIQPNQPIPTTSDVRQAIENPKYVSKELRMLAKQLAEEYRFFHWHLAFPEVFRFNEQSGFDVVLGNPPWEKYTLMEKEFFADKDEKIASAKTKSSREALLKKLKTNNKDLFIEWKKAVRKANIFPKFIQNSDRFPLSSYGELNTYVPFTELSANLVNSDGRSGMVVKSGIYSSDISSKLFSYLVGSHRIIALFDFQNTNSLFTDVGDCERFSLLIIAGCPRPKNNMEFAFYCKTVNEILEKSFEMTLEDFNLLSPNTGKAPILGNKSDRNLLLKIARQFPIIEEISNNKNYWSLEFGTLFHASGASKHFCTKEELIEKDYELQPSMHFIKDNNLDYLPFFEGKYIQQYDHRFSSFENISRNLRFGRKPGTYNPSLGQKQNPYYEIEPRYWIDKKTANERIEYKLSITDYYFAARRVTNVISNTRTVMACIMPGLPANDMIISFNIKKFRNRFDYACKCLLLLSLFNSIPFDYSARLKVSENLLKSVLYEIPLPIPKNLGYNPDDISPLAIEIISTAFELTYTSHALLDLADDLWKTPNINFKKNIIEQKLISDNFSNIPNNEIEKSSYDVFKNSHKYPFPPYVWDYDRRFQLQTKLDAIISHLYNLKYDELAYILDTFPIARRKDEEQFNEYHTKRVILEKFDTLADDPILEGACIPYDERVSVLKKPRKKQEPKPESLTKTTPPPVPETEHEADSEAKPMEVEERIVNQPSLIPQKSDDQEEEKAITSDYTQYRCPICDKRVLGFYKEEHTREIHGGKDPGYQKLD